MKKLDKVVKVKGTGIPNLTSKCVLRDDDKAMYLRSDGYYEVFLIKVSKEEHIHGVLYPKRELYPNNEAFGASAWCIENYNRGLKKYNSL